MANEQRMPTCLRNKACLCKQSTYLLILDVRSESKMLNVLTMRWPSSEKAIQTIS